MGGKFTAIIYLIFFGIPLFLMWLLPKLRKDPPPRIKTAEEIQQEKEEQKRRDEKREKERQAAIEERRRIKRGDGDGLPF